LAKSISGVDRGWETIGDGSTTAVSMEAIMFHFI
jgi:hypothetical protein